MIAFWCGHDGTEIGDAWKRDMRLQNSSSRRCIGAAARGCMLVFGTMLSAFLQTTQAGPEGAQVVHGEVSFSQSGNTTSITASNKSIINYSSFDIAGPEIVEFIQPGRHASVLNRINSATPTNIDGTLRANGIVFFVNPAGVYIGEGAQINVNQLVASGLNISDADFMSGRMNFAGGDGTVINRGDIVAEAAYLVGREVVNSGNISCPAGHVIMAAGDRVFLREHGSDILVEVEPPTQPQTAELQEPETVVSNEGSVTAAAGSITLAAGDIYSHLISNTGSLTVSAEAESGGQVVVAGGGEFSNAGTITATSDGANGGTVAVSGANVINSGTIDVTGTEGGNVAMEATSRLGQFGTIRADGASSDGGKVDLRAGEVVALRAESLTTANAGLTGDGGDVTVSSSDTALFWPDARIEATGGTESGHGGSIELSGHEQVYARGSVDASAPRGSAGTFLLDPTDITVIAGEGEASCPVQEGGGTFTPAWYDDASVIPDTVIEDCLNNGTNVVLDTASHDLRGPYDGDGDIIVAAPITPPAQDGPVDVTLTLQAADDIVVEEGARIDGSDLGSAKLNVVLSANYATADDDDGAAGSVQINADILTNGGSFTSSGVDFDNSNGVIHTYVQDPLAGSGDVYLDHTRDVTVGLIEAGIGDVTIKAGGAIAGTGSEAPANIVGGVVDLTAETGRVGPLGVVAKRYLDASTLEDSAGIIISSPGDLRIGMVNAGQGNVTITASGTIAPIVSDPAPDVAGGVVNLIAQAGKIDHLDVAVSKQLYATTLENADIIMSSPGELRLGSADTGGRIDIEANGAMTVAGGDKVEVRADESMTLHAGARGEGNLSFDPGATLSSKHIVLQAGDGPGGHDTTASVDPGGMVIAAGNTSLKIWQDGSITDTPAHAQLLGDGVAGIDLQLQSDDGSVTSSTAHDWKSITATALGDGITLSGSGTISTGMLNSSAGNIVVHSSEGNLNVNGSIIASGGGVKLLADEGGVYSNDGGVLNVSISGYSNDTDTAGVGVRMPTCVAPPGDKAVAAIVISSHDSLSLGPHAVLDAQGIYGAGAGDDRRGVGCACGPPETYATGDPFDVAIYVGSFGRGSDGGGDVTVNASVWMDAGGTMVIDAENTVHDFTGTFRAFWEKNDGANGLELISRTTETLNEAAKNGTLPHADDVLEQRLPYWFTGAAYVLHGMHPAQVLRKVETPGVGSVHPEELEDDEIVPWPPETPIPDPEPPILVRRGGRLLTMSALNQGMPLRAGDEIETPEGVRAFMEFQQGAHIVVEPKARVTAMAWGVSVDSGEIWFDRLSARAGDRFEVSLAYVTVVVPGTQFRSRRVIEPDEISIEAISDELQLYLHGTYLGTIRMPQRAMFRKEGEFRVIEMSDTEWTGFKKAFEQKDYERVQTTRAVFPAYGLAKALARLFWKDVQE